jgi:phage-related minor tail protein
MAGNKIVGITIDIEGKTSGLTKSLQEANSAISKTSAALKDVDKALQLDPTNVELLAQKEQLLNTQIEQTNNKLEIMQQVATDANAALERGDISQEQYASLTAEISRTNSELGSLNEQADENAQAMQDIEDGVDGAADEMDELSDASEETGKGLETLKVTAEAVGAAMAAAFAAAVSAAKEVGQALIDSTMETAAFADEMMTMSSKTGLSTDTLQELTYAAELLDVDVGTVTGSMTKMEKTMSSAAEANEKYREAQAELDAQLAEGKITRDEWVEASEAAEAATVTAYDKIGVAVQNADGSFRSAEEVFWDTIDALGEIEDPVERDLAAMELMGKSAKELNPLIEAGSGAFRELAEEAHETGYVMNEDTLDAFGAFDDQMVRFNNATDNAQHALGGILLPMLGDLASDGTDYLNEFAQAVSSSGGDVDAIGDAISKILPKVFETVNKIAPKIFKLIGQVVDNILQIFIDNLPQFVNTAMDIIKALADTLLKPDNIKKIIDAAVNIVLTLVEYIIQNLPLIIEAAIKIIVAVVQGLTEALPKLIPAIIEALKTIVKTLIDNLPLLLEATLQLVIAVAMAIIDNLPEIISALVEVVAAVVGFLLSPEGLGLIVDAGYQLLVGLVTKLPEALTEIMSGIGDIVDDILGAFGDDGLAGGLSEIWNGIWDMIKGVINTIIGGINGMISAIEGAINAIIGAINSLSWEIPSWVPGLGGYTFGFDIPKADFPRVPELAQGAVIQPNNPFLAVLGDQSNGVNIEAPLDTIKQAVAEVTGLGGQEIIIPVYIGQERIETIIAQANSNLSFISGGR